MASNAHAEQQEISISLSSTLSNHIKQNGIAPQPIFEQVISLVNFFGQQAQFMSKAEILGIAFQIIDQIIEQKKITDPMDVSCTKGCSFCCRMNVDMTELEADVLVNYAHKHNIPVDKNYLKKQLRLSPEELPLSKEYSSCMFLAKDNTCKVYDVRPMACRKYFVVTPAEECNIPAFPKHMVASIVDPDVEAVVSAIDTLEINVSRMPGQLLKAIKKNPGK
jgi:Fe-S-cluster containining protein